eukprot:4398925-Amphidinium_carterae.1
MRVFPIIIHKQATLVRQLVEGIGTKRGRGNMLSMAKKGVKMVPYTPAHSTMLASMQLQGQPGSTDAPASATILLEACSKGRCSTG